MAPLFSVFRPCSYDIGIELSFLSMTFTIYGPDRAHFKPYVWRDLLHSPLPPCPSCIDIHSSFPCDLVSVLTDLDLAGVEQVLRHALDEHLKEEPRVFKEAVCELLVGMVGSEHGLQVFGQLLMHGTVARHGGRLRHEHILSQKAYHNHCMVNNLAMALNITLKYTFLRINIKFV